MTNLNTELVSAHLREKAINLSKKELLITNYFGTDQEKDLSELPNCKGYGRIRHFKLHSGNDWPNNPLPILPASKALKLNPDSEIRAQVFQNSVCNWRCWYCFVDFKLLSGNQKYSTFLNCDELIELYLNEDNPAPMIDLSGGQPDLTPEWVPWMMQTLNERGLSNIYLWSDDNLSNDYFWKYLSDNEIDLISNYKMYSRVCCFKGIDEQSFSLNTKAEPKLFANQFELCRRLLSINIDLYCYITLTSHTDTKYENVIPQFLDSIQNIDEMLPLRIIPLKVSEFTPMSSRMNDKFYDMMNGQYNAIEVWQKELLKRFHTDQLMLNVTEVELKKY
jgi:uncharacterized Fe-S cluster-containing radical SAM superfamily protein